VASSVSPSAGSTSDHQDLRGIAAAGSSGEIAATSKTHCGRDIDGSARDRSALTKEPGLKERLRRPLMTIVPVVAVTLGIAIYFVGEPYVSTDNAFVRAAKVTVNARVAGQAVEIAVRDNQRVRQGQVLFRIDPEP
jgi:membrane fusion protein (multidrug efflux system)